MLDDLAILNAEQVNLASVLTLPCCPVERGDEIAFGHSQEAFLIGQGAILGGEQRQEGIQPITDIRVVLDVLLRADELELCPKVGDGLGQAAV